MNTNNFQNAVPQQMQQNNMATKQQILSNLRSQQCPPGWQQTFRLEFRAGFVHQITTQLFLLKPEMTEPKALDVAITFERREFFRSADEETYKNQCSRKLSEIAEARRNQVNVMNQRRLQNQPVQGFGAQQQMFQQGMVNPDQFQQGLGGNPLQQLNQAQNMARLQQAQQIQQQQLANAARMHQGLSSGQATTNIPSQAQQSNGPHTFTPEEHLLIQHKAQQMAINLTDAERENVARKVRNLPEQMKIQLRQQGVNPIQAYLHLQATMQYRQEKARAMMMPQNPALLTANNATTQLQPTLQPGMPSQGMNPQQLNQISRNGNVNQQILAQQQEALRLQHAGQVVVPGNPGHGRSGAHQTPQPQQQHQQQPGRPTTAWPVQHPSAFQQQGHSLWSNVQGPQIPQTPGQAPTPNLTTGGQQSGLQGQMDGLSGTPSMRAAQQTPAMPTLNQPMATSAQTQGGPSPRPGQPASQFLPGNTQPEANGPTKAPVGQNTNLERYRNLPLVIQQQLAKLPSEAARRQFILSIQARQHEMRQKQTNLAKGSATRGLQNGVQPQQPGVSGEGAKNHGIQTNPEMSGQVVHMANVGVQQPVSTNQVDRATQGPGQPPRQGAMMTNLTMNEEQTRFMDGVEFPRRILSNKNTFGRMPESAKTWGELKQFVSQNARSLPEGTLRKLGELQAQAYHLNVSHINQQRQRLVQQHGNAAPTAQMVSGNQVDPQNMGFGAPGAPQMPPIPQPTIQEIQAVRNNLQGNAQGMSDDQIGSIIMSKRHQARQNNMAQNHHALNQQQQQLHYDNMLRAQHFQHSINKNAALQATQAQQAQQSQPQIRPPVQKAPQANMSQSTPTTSVQAKQVMANRAGAPVNQKNLKRNNHNMSEDVVEIADPKFSKQTLASKGVQPTQASPRLTQQQFEALSTQQKAQYVAQRQKQNQMALNNQLHARLGLDPAKFKQELEQARIRVQAILAEVHRNLGRRPSQPMSPNTRGSMIQKLRESQPMAQSVDMALTYLYKMTGNEERVREMARMVRDNNFTPVEYFTVTAQELDQIIYKLKEQCAYILSKMASLQQKGAANQQQSVAANQPGPKVSGSLPNQQQTNANTQPQMLTAESLHRQQEAIQRSGASSLQISHDNVTNNNNHSNNYSNSSNSNNNYHHNINNNSKQYYYSNGNSNANGNGANGNSNNQDTKSNNRPPAAPTTTHAPFPFGQQSPQGIPVIYNPKNELTQDKLVLPPAKKRKNHNPVSAPSTPAQASQTPGSQSSPLNKKDSPEAKRAPLPATKLRCTISGCKTKSFFINQAELNKHQAQVHRSKEEEITDPLAFCLEGLRMILSLDENGKTKSAESTSANSTQASLMRKSASSQDQNSKHEVASPISRIPTGTGPSPSANFLKTPQPSGNVKTPASDTKSSGQAAASKTAPSKAAETQAEDSWANAKVPKQWFHAVFSDVADLNRPVSIDFLTDWLERNPFSLSSDDSSKSSNHSPHASDISANDELNIHLSGNGSKNDWIPSDWLDDGLVDDLAASVLDPVLEMDWDTAFGDGGSQQKDFVVGRGRKRDEADASDEFLRVYAPDKLEERTKKDHGRKR
ncbi:MAG: hypothetical protein Q9163_005206, partial [Psora crenata]